MCVCVRVYVGMKKGTAIPMHNALAVDVPQPLDNLTEHALQLPRGSVGRVEKVTEGAVLQMRGKNGSGKRSTETRRREGGCLCVFVCVCVCVSEIEREREIATPCHWEGQRGGSRQQHTSKYGNWM